MKLFRSRLFIALFASIVSLVVAAGVAWATVPDSGGVIHGCYANANGALRVVDNPSSCKSNETALPWNEAGVQGLQGIQGPPGIPGKDGAPGIQGPPGVVAGLGTNTGGAAAGNGATCTLGQVLLSASPVVTAGGVAANGQILSISQNTALFSLLGTTYGGDGISSFALPDLRSVTPNNMTYSICVAGIFPVQS